jgi:uncharacterized protein
LEHIYRYPVKSCRGHRLDEALVEPWGLAGDRRWMLVDETGSVVTAREYPRLVLAVPSPFSDGIVVSARGMAGGEDPGPVWRAGAGERLGK